MENPWVNQELPSLASEMSPNYIPLIDSIKFLQQGPESFSC